MAKKGFSLEGMEMPTPGRDAPGGSERTPFRVTASDDFVMLDPAVVELRGEYVRTVDESDPEFAGFVDAIRSNGAIDQPIGIRLDGDPMDPDYILIYGMRRLMAARAAGLKRIPAKNYGFEMDEERAFLLQVVENEARKDPTPGETAHGFAVLLGFGERQVDIAERAGRSESYVSYMSKVGKAILELDETARRAVYDPDTLQVRDCQALAKIKDLDKRVEALKAVIGGTRPASNGNGRRPKKRLFTRRHKKTQGRTFRVTWAAEDLGGDDGAAFIDEVERFLEKELRTLREKRQEIAD